MGSRRHGSSGNAGCVFSAALVGALIIGAGIGLRYLAFSKPEVMSVIFCAGIVVALAAGAAALYRNRRSLPRMLGNRRAVARFRAADPQQLRISATAVPAWLAVAQVPAAFVEADSAAGHASGRGPAAVLLALAVILVTATIALVEAWCGRGTFVRVLRSDPFTVAASAAGIALAVTGPLLMLVDPGSRPAWAGLAAAQLLWAVGGSTLCLLVGAARRRGRRALPWLKAEPGPADLLLRRAWAGLARARNRRR
jgi:hypothetical protein